MQKKNLSSLRAVEAVQRCAALQPEMVAFRSLTNICGFFLLLYVCFVLSSFRSMKASYSQRQQQQQGYVETKKGSEVRKEAIKVDDSWSISSSDLDVDVGDGSGDDGRESVATKRLYYREPDDSSSGLSAHEEEGQHDGKEKGGLPHPHMGATDSRDGLNYVHDAKSLRLSPPSLDFSHGSTTKAEACNVGGARGLGDADFRLLDSISVFDGDFDDSSKVLCTIYTYEKAHAKKLPALRETWAKRCDGFVAASTATDGKYGTVNILHEGPEEYENIWQKVRSIWAYMHDNYLEDYEWFYIGGDDVYVIVENLKMYLQSEEIRRESEDGQNPMFLGRRFKLNGNEEVSALFRCLRCCVLVLQLFDHCAPSVSRS